ncbi:MAG: hypothetical protein JW787_11560 [Sedimentisphaerales bacterium]|nr:hypothetical protein [Sedimentisphaerales bacterium]
MCISLVTDRYIPIKLLTEQVFLSLKKGELCTHEVYDIFLTPKKKWNNAKIFCISPHNLISDDGNLLVQIVSFSDSSGQDDFFYNNSPSFKSDYNSDTESFTINFPSGRNGFTLGIDSFTGKVLIPTISIPNSIKSNTRALELMEDCGTLFELSLGNLEAGNDYMFRIVIDPKERQSLPEKRTQDIEELDGALTNWVQDSIIPCPKTCRFNFIHHIKVSQDIQEYTEAGSIIKELVSNQNMRLMPVKLQQVILILPVNAELIVRNPEGCIWEVSTHTLLDSRFAAVWSGGVDQYWIDDPESIAQKIFEYCRNWGKDRPKTKEEISIVLAASHENCSLIIDELCRYGALNQISPVRFSAVDRSEDELSEIFESVASSQDVVANFGWRGYQIRYSVQYRYLDSEDRKKLLSQIKRNNWAFWIGLAGIAIGLISLLAALLAIII